VRRRSRATIPTRRRHRSKASRTKQFSHAPCSSAKKKIEPLPAYLQVVRGVEAHEHPQGGEGHDHLEGPDKVEAYPGSSVTLSLVAPLSAGGADGLSET